MSGALKLVASAPSKFYGEKYDASLSTTAIAARLRADIKAAIADGRLPRGLVVRVRSSYYAGGSAIDVKIAAAPFQVVNPDRVAFDLANPHAHRNEHTMFTAEANAVLETLRGMMNAYNHDGSDISVDYFDVKFYGDAGVDWQLEARERGYLVDALTSAVRS